MQHWTRSSVFYHIYPLGFCGASPKNDFSSQPVPALKKIYTWINHILDMQINAIYLGPVFESTAHGYDTADYFKVDRRLGDNYTLKELTGFLHTNGIKVILDGVFNHVGRDFWAFKDVLNYGEASAYRNWFSNIDFSKKSPYNDPFSYEGWNNHYDLVKLNLDNADTRNHLLAAVEMWINEFDIDGLRLDAADCVSIDFLSELSRFTKKMKPDFWLMGEVIHGDYRNWVNTDTLDSATNYECYKGLYSSHNDVNYFEIAYSLKRQFGADGIYKDLLLYNFVDNHDVSRIMNTLKNEAYIYPLLILLFTMPGIPSIYYGSEFGIEGMKQEKSDELLRPELDLTKCKNEGNMDILRVTKILSGIRQNIHTLGYGSYEQVYVNHEQFVFMRRCQNEICIVAVNSSMEKVSLTLNTELPNGIEFIDILNNNEKTFVTGNSLDVDVYPAWGKVLLSSNYSMFK